MVAVRIRAFRSSIAALVAWGLLLTGLSHAITIRVPQDYAKIQDALLGATHGDVIVVSPGIYLENIDFLGKNVVLRSTNPTNSAVVATTIIDGNFKGATVTFSGSEASSCALSGFTIKNATSYGGIFGGSTKARIEHNVITNNSAYYGGGLYDCDGTIQNNAITDNSAIHGGGLAYCDGTIQNNVIANNSASGGNYGGGGGLYECDGTIRNNVITSNSASGGGGLSFCAGTIQNNVITNNSASAGYGWGSCGGGLHHCGGTIQNNVITSNSTSGYDYGYGGGLYQCNGTIQNNTIANNSATWGHGGGYGYSGGGGLYDCVGTIRNNTIYGNSASTGGGLYECSGVIVNCLIWGNTAPLYPQLSNSSIPNYSCIQGDTVGGQGNIGSDPRFRSLTDFHLQPGSPCIDAGTNQNCPAFDKDGKRRPLDGNGDGRAVVDMGAYEFVLVTSVPSRLWQLYR